MLNPRTLGSRPGAIPGPLLGFGIQSVSIPQARPVPVGRATIDDHPIDAGIKLPIVLAPFVTDVNAPVPLDMGGIGQFCALAIQCVKEINRTKVICCGAFLQDPEGVAVPAWYPLSLVRWAAPKFLCHSFGLLGPPYQQNWLSSMLLAVVKWDAWGSSQTESAVNEANRVLVKHVDARQTRIHFILIPYLRQSRFFS